MSTVQWRPADTTPYDTWDLRLRLVKTGEVVVASASRGSPATCLLRYEDMFNINHMYNYIYILYINNILIHFQCVEY